jgi:hypothetical protein
MAVIWWVGLAVIVLALFGSGYAAAALRYRSRRNPGLSDASEPTDPDFEPTPTHLSLYQAQCEKLQEGRHAAYEQFDKALLTLSAGALGLSVTFIKDIVPLSTAVQIGLLFGSWCLFALAILSTLASFIASQRAFDRSLRDAEEYYLHGNSSARARHGMALTVTQVLNWSSTVSFVIALVLTILFATQNIINVRRTKHEHTTTGAIGMQEEPDSNGESAELGEVPSRLVPLRHNGWVELGEVPPRLVPLPQRKHTPAPEGKPTAPETPPVEEREDRK